MMLALSSIFQEANNQPVKDRDVLVLVEDATLYAEKATETDWGNNTAESNVDYTSSPPDSGDVILDRPFSWALESPSGTPPSVRFGHSAIEHSGDMYVFGGSVGGATYLNDLYKYSISGNSWSTLSPTGGPPAGRWRHSAIEYGGKMYIYGGNISGGVTNTLWEYDITGNAWTALTSGGTARSGHTAIEYGGKMYIYGGQLSGAVSTNTIYEYDISTDTWSALTSGGTARYWHSAIEYDGSMYIYGGTPNASSYLNDVYEYNIAGDSWTAKSTSGPTRGAHSAAPHYRSFFVFGGWDGVSADSNQTWEYNMGADTWTQRTSGATARDSHSAIEYNGEMFIFGGYDGIGSSLNSLYSNYIGYEATGNITTDNIDIGSVPTVAGEWTLNDVKPIGTTLTYTAEYSATGAWGGEEVSIGTIYDGLVLSILARYWRVTATLTTNTARDETPILQSIKADYSTYRRFNRIPDLGYEALVEDVSSLTSKVDFFQPASIGQISVNLNMTDAVSDWVYGDTLYNKIVQVKLGFKYPGFVEADYIHYFTGAIDDWNVDDHTLNLTLKDLSKEWKLPVPSKWETIGDDVTWTATHHIDIMLDIFQNYINVRDSGLLLDSFATVKAATPAYVVTRTITGKTEDAKKLVEELRVLLFAFFLPRGDGKIGIKQFDSTEAAATTFTDDNTLSIKWQANSKDLINRTSIYFDWDTLGDKEENFDSYDGGDDTTSQTNFQEIKPYILKDKWTLAAQASQIADLETKILAQFDNMPSTVTITCDAKDIAYEAGDMANVTTLEAPGSGGAGITDEKYLITSKNLDFLGDRIIFKGLKVA